MTAAQVTIVDRVDEEHDAHVRQEGGIPRHLEGVNDDAGMTT